MVDDPYKVLGVSRTASMDEVKKAYRQKAKQYHPDMHPDDPRAAEKMNEVNEAYDMILNPGKYQQQREQQQAQQQARQGYGGYGYGGQQQSGSANGQPGYGGFGDFDFEDIFRQFTGSYGASGGGIPRPQPRADDPLAFSAAVRNINAGQYQEALRTLGNVMSNARNARWFYLSALANYGLGNRVAAWEHIQRAAAMEPNNYEYAAAKRAIGRDAESYQNTGRGFHMDTTGSMGICATLCLLQLCCRCGYC